MKVIVDLDEDDYVDAYCVIGTCNDFIEAEVDNYNHFGNNFSSYKYINGKLEYKPRLKDKDISL